MYMMAYIFFMYIWLTYNNLVPTTVGPLLPLWSFPYRDFFQGHWKVKVTSITTIILGLIRNFIFGHNCHNNQGSTIHPFFLYIATLHFIFIMYYMNKYADHKTSTITECCVNRIYIDFLPWFCTISPIMIIRRTFSVIVSAIIYAKILILKKFDSHWHQNSKSEPYLFSTFVYFSTIMRIITNITTLKC